MKEHVEPTVDEMEVELTEGDILWHVIQLLGKAPQESRARIVAAAGVFHGVRGATAIVAPTEIA